MLTRPEADALARLEQARGLTHQRDELMWRYYHGKQRIRHLGYALPQAMQQRATVISNWCRVAVDGHVHRQQVSTVRRIDQVKDDPDIRRIRDASNFDHQLAMFNRDRAVFGRAIASVFPGPNGMPRIRVESPREMVLEIDEYREVVVAAARFYGADLTLGTLYVLGEDDFPSRTIHVRRERYGARWQEVKRDEYGGPLPLFLHVNRRESGSWTGESQMADLIPLVDAAARSLTLLGFSQDAHGFPKLVLSGVTTGDFKDAKGNLVPRLEAYFDALTLLSNKDAKAHQLTAADLKNFDAAIDLYGRQASSVSYLPAHYYGVQPRNNPASEGALMFEQGMMLESIEAQNREVGVTLGWMFTYALGMKIGEVLDGNQVQVAWHDPSTPTMSQRYDALIKARQAGTLSIEGVWNGLGWSEAQKAEERDNMAREADDPIVARFNALMDAGNGSPPA